MIGFLRHLFQPAIAQADTPKPFGYKQTWLAISASDTAAVAQALGLSDTRLCNWEQGIQLPTAELFISPAVRGWIFVLGQALADADERKITPLLNRLSAEFGIAHYFATQRVVEYHCWARSERGELLRGYAYLGERGETLWDEGSPIAETQLGLHFFDERSAEASDDAYWEGLDLQFPDEDCVMQLARHWCIAPVDLRAQDALPALGICGALKG